MRPAYALSLAVMLSPPAGAAAQTARPLPFERPDKTLPHEFSQIRGLRELRDGRVLVTDRLEEQVFLADFTTGRVTPVGRVGAGPSEYHLPGTLLPWPGDSTLLVDEGNARFAIIGPDLAIRRSFSSQAADGPYTIWPRAADALGRLYFVIPRWAAGPRMREKDSIAIARVDPTTRRVERLALVNGSTEPPGGVQHGIPYVPFAPEDAWQAGPNGQVVIVRSADYHVEWRSADGRVLVGPRVTYRALPVTQADKVAYTRTFMEHASIGGRGSGGTAPTALSAVPEAMRTDEAIAGLAARNIFAARRPPFTDAVPRFSPEGTLWVERSLPLGSSPQWDIFDASGRLVAQATLPEGRRLVGLGNHALYAATRDESGIEHLERYAR